MAERPTIVTLIASATEIVCALGMREHLVGISHECDYPPEVKGLPVLSSPKVDPARPSGETDRRVREILGEGLSVYRVRVEELERLRPDLIVTQDHCEVCAVSLKDVEDALCAIELRGTRVCTLHPATLDDVGRDFRRVAGAAGVPERGDTLVAAFRARLERLRARTSGVARPRVACLEWLEPPMVAGGWMPELVRIAGGEPVIVDSPAHFRAVSWDELREADPDLVVVLPCGYPVERTLEELRDEPLAGALRAVGAGRCRGCWVADGNAYFNRPGPRLADSAEILAGIFHPERCGDLRARYRGEGLRWA